MQGDYSRWTFDALRDYRSVLLQQGRVLLDADWNEQAELTRWHDEIRMLDTIGRSAGPAAGAGFTITDGAGAAPAGAAWAELLITPGRYYVDGVLAAARVLDGGVGIPLPDQPYLAAIGADPGLPEPAADGRYALYLDVWTHEVTADEDVTLREPALGGPDTSTRARTVWQVRVAPIEDTQSCSDLQGPDWLSPPRGAMTPALTAAPSGADPCQITTSGGYTRLENQLYRVQVHDADAAGAARFLWSRENASVVAGLTGIGTTVVTGMSASLTVDRVGHDDELSIHEGDTVEVTSADLELRGTPGFLATCGPPDGLTLPVAWLDTAPASVAALGRAPIVRRWEAPPQAAAATAADLEDGIAVGFSPGALATGDFWLIPARTVRLVYGLTALSGTLDWPADAAGNPLPATPLGPVHHIAPLAVVTKDATGWTRVSDCRHLVPSLDQLVSIDLIGGDGQEGPPGTELPQPIRFAVRDGGLPVAGARVRVTPSGGTVTDGTFADAGIITATGPDGVAAVRWTLDPAGAETQTLTAQRLDDHDNGLDVQIIATARLAVAAGRPPGLHVIKAELNAGRPFTNDSSIKIGELVEGITIALDGSIDPGSVTGKPVVRVVLDIPWATPRETPVAWPAAPFVGSRPIQLDATVDAGSGEIVWKPSADATTWLTQQLMSGLHDLTPPWHGIITGRFIIDGWAVVGKDPKLHLNGHSTTFIGADGTTQLNLPTDDEVTGGQFIQWFTLV